LSDYGKLLLSIWSNREFTCLNAREQQVFMLLLSYPTRNLAGVLPLTLRRWASATADATVANVQAAVDVLAKTAGPFILVDEDTEEVLIRTFIRNDEVWKQPNLMTSALKCCRGVASLKLKSTLSTELFRVVNLMPTGTPAQKKIHAATLEVAKSLVETPNEAFAEPLPEPFVEPLDKPIDEGCVVVGNVSTVGLSTTTATINDQLSTPDHQSAELTERNAQARTDPDADEVYDLATSERGAALSTPVTIGATRLVSTVIRPGMVPAAAMTMLRIKTSQGLNEGRSEDDMAECLRVWLTKNHLGPGALLSCLVEVDKRKINPVGLATSDRRVQEAQALKQKFATRNQREIGSGH
jgi:hypothetical protein